MAPPRTPRRGRPPGSCTWGRFVDVGGTISLRDRANNPWPLDQVTICHGGWGFDDEGVAKLPRPSKFNDAGEETEIGDRVLILFLEGSAKRPVVLPGFRRIKATAGSFLPYHHKAPDSAADPNRLAARIQPRDGDGVPVGSIDLEVGYETKAAARVSVGPADGEGPRTYATMDDSDGSVQVGTKGGAVLRMAPGQLAFVSEEGHLVLLDAENGIQVAWSNGGPGGTADPMINAKDALLLILATLTKVVGRTEFSNGISPLLSPLVVRGMAGAGFFFDLQTVLAAVGTLGIAPATAMGLKLGIELGAPGTNPGYLSDVAKSTG